MPRNLVEMLLRRRAQAAAVSGLVKVEGRWREFTWGEVIERVRAISEGLVELGVKPGDRVCIFGQTSLEWCLTDMAIMGAGAISVPIYASNTPQEVAYIVNDAGAKIVVFDDDVVEHGVLGRYSRLQAVRDELASLEHLVAFKLPSNPAKRLTSLWDLEARGRAAAARADALEQRARAIAPDDLACIIYTSGTAGRPKGVMLTHGNWVAQTYAVMAARVLVPGDRLLLFLPLAHAFARATALSWLGHDLTLAFAESVDKVLDNAAEVKPTVLPAVPRVFEKAFAKVIADGSSAPGLQGMAFRWAMTLFDQYAAARAEGRAFRSARWELAKRLVFAKVGDKLKARFGGNVRAFVSGGAPLAPKIAYFFELCGLDILEGYGLTETCAPTHSNIQGSNRIGTVGPAFPGIEVKTEPDGEVLVRGPTIMKGYYRMPEATADALTADGWLRTGDIGAVDPDGFLRITDRKKDLIKTSGGKYVAPSEIENALKTDPLVSQVSIVGDKRKFVSALFTVAAEPAATLAAASGRSYDGFGALSQSPEVRARLQAVVDTVNATLPSFATVKRFAVLDHDWSQETGELTPTTKVKRRVIAEKYKDVLDRLYAE